MTTESEQQHQPEEPAESTALVEFTAATGNELDELKRLGIIMVEAGYFADAQPGSYKQEVAKAIVKLMVGQELGLQPIQAMRGVYMTREGAIGYSSNLIASAIKKSSRYDYRVLETTAERCVIAFIENGERVGESTWTIADAERAGLMGKSNWKNYPGPMLFARALSAGSRMFAPDLFDGPAYTPEEIEAGTPEEQLAAVVDPETGEILEPDADREQPRRRVDAAQFGQGAAEVGSQCRMCDERLQEATVDALCATCRETLARENQAANESNREGVMQRFDDSPPLGD